MPQDQSQYVLLKLRSGDEIIAKKNGAKKGILILSRPLQMQRSTFLDPLTGGVKKNICVLRDWLEFTTNLECEIPEDFVVLNAEPTPDMIQRYINELDKLDNPNKYNTFKTKAPKPSKAETEDLLDDYIKSLMSSLPSTPTPKQEQVTPPEQKPPLTLPPSSSMVTASFSMSPDVFLNIVLNMPMFDGWGGELGDDSSEGEDGGDDDSEGDQTTPPPKNKPSNKKKPKRDDDTPPSGDWHGRFGFPK